MGGILKGVAWSVFCFKRKSKKERDILNYLLKHSNKEKQKASLKTRT